MRGRKRLEVRSVDLLEAYLNILVIFGVMFVGYALTWRKWFDNQIADVFSKLVLNIALPLNMFLNMTEKFTKAEFLSLAKGILLPALSIVITYLISIAYAKLTKVPTGRIGTFRVMFTASNTIFMGLPVNIAIFGEKAIPYALLYYICNTTFFFTLGIYLIQKDNLKVEEVRGTFSFRFLLRKLLSPALLGFFIGLCWMLLEIPLAVPLRDFAKYLSQLTTPLSLFVIGIIIYQTGIKNLKLDKDTLGVLLGRYLISPLVVVLLSKFIEVPALMLNVFILQSAMPVQNSMPILAKGYGADEGFATSSLVYSILSYLFVIIVLLKFIY